MLSSTNSYHTKEIMEPSVNICVGVRWLFAKKRQQKSGYISATWDDAVAEYKGILKAIVENKDLHHNPDPNDEIPKFRTYFLVK